MRITRVGPGIIIGVLVVHCMGASFSTGALAADPGVPLIDGLYTAAGCPTGYISGDASVMIGTGNYFGGGRTATYSSSTKLGASCPV